MIELPAKFKERMKAQLGAEYGDFIAAYDRPAVRGLRVNTLKVGMERFLSLCPWETEPSETYEEGLVLVGEAEHIGTHPYHIAGLFYMQEPSAMSVIAEAEIEPGMKVLDLCAAPGGKSGAAAAKLDGKGLLVSNEIVPSRAKQLARNLERLGIVNAVVTSAHPDAIAESLPCFFDRVIVDAPCSGEGMFRKDPTAIAEWSPEHVASCAVRQSAILESAAKCVAPGGKLVYSTCTFSPEENEGVIDGFLKEHDDFELEFSRRLYPHLIKGEGHFSARLVRRSSSFKSNLYSNKVRKQSAEKNGIVRRLSMQETAAVSECFFDTLEGKVPDASALRLFRNSAVYCPFDYPESLLKLPLVSFGIEIGELSKKHLKPSHSFFMAAHGFKYRYTLDFPADSRELTVFLGGNTIAADNIQANGVFVPVTVEGYPVGFGKITDGVLKNHLPKGLQIGAYR